MSRTSIDGTGWADRTGGGRVGTMLRVMSYNIGHYNMGSAEKGYPEDLIEEKSGQLKIMLMETAPDLLGLQEDWTWIDRGDTRRSVKELYRPIFRFTAGTGDYTLRARLAAEAGTHQLVRFSTGRYYRRCTFKLPGKYRLLFVTCHLSAYAAREAERMIELEELFAAVGALQYDCCVITGDFNTNTGADREKLREECRGNGFSMAIGDYLPWIPTCYGRDGRERYSFDNILVSGTGTIRRVAVLGDWYGRLYSDHVPLIADVALE